MHRCQATHGPSWRAFCLQLYVNSFELNKACKRRTLEILILSSVRPWSSVMSCMSFTFFSNSQSSVPTKVVVVVLRKMLSEFYLAFDNAHGMSYQGISTLLKGHIEGIGDISLNFSDWVRKHKM